ncbi:hypothetical protein FQN55_005905 [Onygenales sp. PD_40]|nr:hypothetical protein FQN55_005905 [Onygenales sp. PD_40]
MVFYSIPLSIPSSTHMQLPLILTNIMLTLIKDGYKVISFVPDSFAVDGRILEPRCRDLDDPNRISDDALRWHFQQAILAHVRGMGQRYWETDFPDGDMIGEIMGGPDAAERMEVELFTRLGCGDDAYG